MKFQLQLKEMGKGVVAFVAALFCRLFLSGRIGLGGLASAFGVPQLVSSLRPPHPNPLPQPTAERGPLNCRRWGVSLSLQLLVLLLWGSLAQAQLAQNFINVTGITTQKLPNAVQIRIETDGSPQFGSDLSDYVNLDGWYPTPTQSLRIRIIRARSKLPGFVPINSYPVDGAVVSMGTETLSNPNFPDGSDGNVDPRVEVELRFAAPVVIRRFTSDTYNSIYFGNYVGPLEASIEPATNRRAILITVVTDRADATAPQRMDRSPEASRQHTLNVSPLDGDRFKLEALHSSLREVMTKVGEISDSKFLVREEIAGLQISLVLPEATLPELLEALQIGYGIGARDEEGTTVLGRGEEFYTAKSFSLKSLRPEKARLLFPDFLLPYLRADGENNALLAVQTPALLDKIETDLGKLDMPRAQFEIKVEAWEIASTLDYNQTLAATRSVGADVETLDLGTGVSTIQVNNGLTDKLSVTLNALASRGKAHLVAAPHVTALSGEQGTIFLGQTRYIKILQNQFGGQIAKAQALQIGTTLGVTPLGDSKDGDVMFSLSPRVSTVDAIEPITGLPTLGIREITSQLRSRPGESVILSGLDFDFGSKTTGKTLRIIPAKRETKEVRRLLVLVSVHRV